MGLLRFLFALSVIAAHVGPILGMRFLGGSLAVQLFFIMSGFYMSLVLNEKYIGKHSYRLFITNRFLRLYPVYGVVMVLVLAGCFVMGAVSPTHEYPVFSQYWRNHPDFISGVYLGFTNLFVLGQDTIMFMGIHPGNGSLYFTSNFWNTMPPLYTFLFIPQAWSLGLELTFFFVAPFILRRGIKSTIAIVAISLALRIFIYYGLQIHNDPWTYRFFPTELLFFMLGNLSYRLYRILGSGQRIIKFAKPVMILFAVMTIEFTSFPSFDFHFFHYGLQELIYLSLFILLLPVLFVYSKHNAFDSMLGELSYPMYITHLMIAWTCGNTGNDYLKSGFSIAVLTISLSYLLVVTVVEPIENMRQRRVKLASCK